MAARSAAYWLAQAAGALIAAAILRASLGDLAHVGATLPSGSQAQSFLWEVVLTFFLMLVIMSVATDTRAVGEAAAIAIGGTVGLDAMFGGPISGASMNPARSFGPAVVSGDLHALWLYIVAPLVGAALGALAYQFVRGEQTRPADVTHAHVLFGLRRERRLGATDGRAGLFRARRRLDGYEARSRRAASGAPRPPAASCGDRDRTCPRSSRS